MTEVTDIEQAAINIEVGDSRDIEDETEQLIGKTQEGNEKVTGPKFNIFTYAFFTLQGCGTLLTWNSLINCPDFFLDLYNDYNTWAISVISGVFMLFNLGGVFLMTFFFGSFVSFGLKTAGMYVAMFIPQILIGPVFGYIKGNQLTKLILTILLGGSCGLFQSVLQNGVFGLAGHYGPNEIQAVMLGQGIVGIIMSFLRILTKATLEDGTLAGFQRSVLVYFAVAVAGNLLCLVSVFVFAIFDLRKEEKTDKQLGKKKEYYATHSMLRRYLLYFWFTKGYEDSFVDRVKMFFAKAVKNVKVNWLEYFDTFYIFTISLSIFPGVSSIVPTTTFADTPFKNGWMAVTLSTLFTTFDFFGRTLAKMDIKFDIKFVTAISFARTGFLVMYIFLVNPPHIFQNDFIPMILMGFMAFSNGLLSTRETVQTRINTAEKLGEEYCENCGQVQTFSICAGVFAGAMLSIAWGFIGNAIKIP